MGGYFSSRKGRDVVTCLISILLNRGGMQITMTTSNFLKLQVLQSCICGFYKNSSVSHTSLLMHICCSQESIGHAVICKMHASCRLCIVSTMSVLRNVSLAAAVSAYAMLSAVTELPREGVTIVTGCGIGAVLDEVWQRLDLLQGTVVKSYQLWEPPKDSNISGAVQVSILPFIL